MIHSSTVTFGAKYLTGMVTSVPPYETFSLIKNNIFHLSKNYKNHFENSNFWGDVGHVTYTRCRMVTDFSGFFLRFQITRVEQRTFCVLKMTCHRKWTTQSITSRKSSYYYIYGMYQWTMLKFLDDCFW